MNTEGKMGKRYRAPAVSKAFAILQAVSEVKEGMTISELALRLGFSKSTVHGLVGTLVDIGALHEQRESRKFSLGTTIVEIAFRNWNYIRLREEAQPYLETLRDAIGQTVFLGLLSRTTAFIIAQAEARDPLKISSPPGSSLPLLAGAVGKVFLAELPEDEALKIIKTQGLPLFTPKSIVDERIYLTQLAEVRKKGYAFDDEEYLPGVRAVAVALKNHRGMPLALWVVGFAASMVEEKLPLIVGETLKTAGELKNLFDRNL